MREYKRAKQQFPWAKAAGVGVVAIVAGVAIFSFMFSGTAITVSPKSEQIRVDGTFTAYNEPGSDTELGYDTVTVRETASQQVTASGSEYVEQKASGTIVIYNDYSRDDQRLVKNTRFETPDGLIYKIPESVVVPGQTESSNGSLEPGTVEVTVYAAEPGEKYNIDRTDFTVPGFQGAPQYDHFYARSKTPMTGGFAGERPNVDEEQLSQTRSQLQSQLRSRLTEKVSSEIPEGFVLLDDTQFLTFSQSSPEGTGQQVSVSIQGTLHGVLFEATDLGAHLARNTVAAYEGTPVRVINPAQLNVTVDDDVSPWQAESFTFSMVGNPTLRWQFDEQQLKQDLAGKEKGAVHTVLSGYPGIERAEVIMRPFWRGQFPSDTQHIRIQTQYESQPANE
jgi:hypothetical protein